MTNNDHQRIFCVHSARLVLWVNSLDGYFVTRGWGYRPDWVQATMRAFGVTQKMVTLHSKRLADDYCLFINGVYQKSTESYKPLGDYWESLNPLNRWGGRYSDGNHFERVKEGWR